MHISINLALIMAVAVSLPGAGQSPSVDPFKDALRRIVASNKPVTSTRPVSISNGIASPGIVAAQWRAPLTDYLVRDADALRRARSIAMPMATATSLPAQSASPAGAPDDFEAALRSMPRPASLSPGVRLTATSSTREGGVSMAPTGLLPARFQKPLKGLDGMSTAEEAVRAGELDALAFIEHQAGPVPLLPGVRQLRCGPIGMKVLFTLGIEASPAYRRAIDDYTAHIRDRAAAPQSVPGAHGTRNRHGDPEESRLILQMMDQQEAAKKNPVIRARMREMARLLQSKGFVLWTGGALPMWRLARTEPFTPAIDILFEAGASTFVPKCAAAGVQVPSGPLFSVMLHVTDPYWRKDIEPTPDLR